MLALLAEQEVRPREPCEVTSTAVRTGLSDGRFHISHLAARTVGAGMRQMLFYVAAVLLGVFGGIAAAVVVAVFSAPRPREVPGFQLGRRGSSQR